MKTTTFIKNYTKALQSGNAAIFLGAGMSKTAGFVDWATLLKDVAEELDLDSNKEVGSLPELAQFYYNKKNNRNLLTELVKNEFCDIKEPDENHMLLAHLPIHTYWTTNYDHLIEESLVAQKKKIDVKVFDTDLTTYVYGSEATVYKMHGDVNHADDTVLLLNEYETYADKHPRMLNALNRDLTNCTFLFLGFSFTDSNLKYILANLRVLAERNKGEMKTHYCIMRYPKKRNGENDEDFEYRCKRQNLVYEDLTRFGVEMVMIDDYKEITEILREINKAYYQNTIYMSGAVADFGKWDQKEAERFVFNLSGALIHEGYRIVTGYGLGIGNSVIGGVLNEVYMKKCKQLDDELIARPFPQGNDDIKKKWPEYRKDMISYTGISIFLFGNKYDKEGNIVLSDGMQQEYEISEAQGNILIPIGATECISRELWKNTMDKYKDKEPYKSLIKEFECIGDEEGYKTPDELIKKIVDIVKMVTK